MKLSEEIANMTVAMESGDSSPTRQEVYTILLRAFVELRMLDNHIRSLEGKLK
jgi:hypothetical protein